MMMVRFWALCKNHDLLMGRWMKVTRRAVALGATQKWLGTACRDILLLATSNVEQTGHGPIDGSLNEWFLQRTCCVLSLFHMLCP